MLEIAAGIAGFVLRGKVDDFVEDYMDKTLKDRNKVWDEVQKDVSFFFFFFFAFYNKALDKYPGPSCSKRR